MAQGEVRVNIILAMQESSAERQDLLPIRQVNEVEHHEIRILL